MEKESKGMFENFKQAASEVFSRKEEEPKKSNLYAGAADTHTAAKPGDDAFSKKPDKTWRFPQRDEKLEEDNDETAYIPKGTKIKGDITTLSNLTFAGEIEGDIESRKSIVVTGRVHGDMKCRSAEIKGATIQGNITVEEALSFEHGSNIAGNLTAGSGTVDGKIEGNINVKDDIRICEHGCVIGDITAGSISVEKGAVIKGQVNIAEAAPSAAPASPAPGAFNFKKDGDTV